MPAVCSLAYSSSSRVQALCGDVLSAAASDKDGRGLISTPVRRKARMGVAHGDHSPLRWLWLWQVQEALNHLLEARSTAVRSSSAVTLAKMSPGVFDPTTAAVGTCLAVLLVRGRWWLTHVDAACPQGKQLVQTVAGLVRDAGGVTGGDAGGQVDLVAAARGVEALSCLATHAKVKNQLSQDADTVKALSNIAAELEAVVSRCTDATRRIWPVHRLPVSISGVAMAQCRKLQANVDAAEEGRKAKFQAPEGFTTDAGPTVYGIAFVAYSLSMSSAMLREVPCPRQACHRRAPVLGGTDA